MYAKFSNSRGKKHLRGMKKIAAVLLVPKKFSGGGDAQKIFHPVALMPTVVVRPKSIR